METKDPNSKSLLSKDDGLWMKMDSKCEANPTGSSSTASNEKPNVTPAVITTYLSVMDDEGADDVFIPHPPHPSYTAPLLPAEGATDTSGHNAGVTLSDGAADATEAEANPCGLDRHHSEKQLMAAHDEADEEVTSAVQMSKECMDDTLLSNDQDSNPCSTYQDKASMDGTGCVKETCHDRDGPHYLDNTTGNEESKTEDVIILNKEQETCSKGRDKYPTEVHSNFSENPENERADSDSCGLDAKDSNLPRDNPDVDLESSEPASKHQNKTEAATNQPQVPDLIADMTSDNEEHDANKSLDSNLTESDCVWRESGATEMQVTRLSFSKGSDEIVSGEEQDEEKRKISTDIQQGEQLLQRLQLVQQRHDVHLLDDPQNPQEGEVEGAKETCEKEKEEFHIKKDEPSTDIMVKDESEDSQAKVRTSSTSTPGPSENQTTGETDDEDQSEDLSPVSPDETEPAPNENRFLSSGHRFSAAEISIEKIHEAAQTKQNLQRAGGVFNLSDNPDILEIPFKTNISLESLLNKTESSQRSDWQFSQQKMQKEISQEIQRELVLVNQGKIPGGYSKGEVRQLKETKLLFEALQQDNMEGPVRHQKPSASVMKGHVYPSVLERTQSLERFCLKSCPVSRTHSLRLYNTEREKSPENLRSKSPTGGSREKTRLSPYPKQDKHQRLHKSMDSISSNSTTLSVETKGKTREKIIRHGSPILKHNPFFKLRPALALQPEVEKDIREAREREEELRRQRCSLYGENKQNREDEESRRTQAVAPDDRRQSRGKLERVWPPPSKNDQMKSDTQQETKVHRAGGQRADLWQRWESGLINGQPPKDTK